MSGSSETAIPVLRIAVSVQGVELGIDAARDWDESQ
jgi:hypothetical protein